MTTIHEPIEFFCGDTWPIAGTLLGPKGEPLTTISEMTWKLDTVDGRKNLLTLSLGHGVAISEPNTAGMWLEATPEQTALIKPGSYYGWLRVTLSSGRVYTEWTGVILVRGKPK